MSAEDYLQSATRLADAEGLDPWTALMRVLLTRLAEIGVPSALATPLKVAEFHWNGHASDLLEQKVSVWRYLDDREADSTQITTPESRIARALLCVLEPEGDDEVLSDTAEWFSAMIDGPEGSG